MILVLGGTSDSLKIAEELGKEFSVILSVATEMGKASAEHLAEICQIEVGRKTKEELSAFIREKKISCLVDGTHPYAVLISENGRTAAEAEGIPYFRYIRPGATGEEESTGEELFWVDTYSEAAKLVNQEVKNGVIFSTLGAKNLPEFLRALSDKKRVVARILPDPTGIQKLFEEGLTFDQIIAMKGPFSTEMNTLMLKESGATVLLTKDSGAAGGFPEKLEAAKNLGIKTIIIRREPERRGNSHSDLSSLLSEVKAVVKTC